MGDRPLRGRAVRGGRRSLVGREHRWVGDGHRVDRLLGVGSHRSRVTGPGRTVRLHRVRASHHMERITACWNSCTSGAPCRRRRSGGASTRAGSLRPSMGGSADAADLVGLASRDRVDGHRLRREPHARGRKGDRRPEGAGRTALGGGSQLAVVAGSAGDPAGASFPPRSGVDHLSQKSFPLDDHPRFMRALPHLINAVGHTHHGPHGRERERSGGCGRVGRLDQGGAVGPERIPGSRAGGAGASRVLTVPAPDRFGELPWEGSVM